jgi:hypothetical protein
VGSLEIEDKIVSGGLMISSVSFVGMDGWLHPAAKITTTMICHF